MVLLPAILAFLLGSMLGLSWQWRTARLLERERLAKTQAEASALRLPQVEAQLSESQQQIQELTRHATRLETLQEEMKRTHQERLAHLKQTEAQLTTTFRALSSEALTQNNQAFLALAKTNLEKFQAGAQADLGKRQEAIDRLVKPVQESLTKFDSRMQQLEVARTEGQASLRQQVSSLASMHTDLQRETAKLATALRSTTVRGRWGEIQLRRVVELAGMLDHCDFFEQKTTDEGRLRPDLLVRLPAGRIIAIDAKAPLDAYLEASEAQDESRRKSLLKKHASQIRYHIRALASKNYAESIKGSPEFVVLFLPGEFFFSAALAEDPTLIELGAEQDVILATPTTLISLLRAVNQGWRHEAISRNAEKISALGRDLYKRLLTLNQHWHKVGRALEGAVHSYNDSIGSLERRLLPKAREFERLDSTLAAVEIPELISQQPRSPLLEVEEEPPATSHESEDAEVCVET